MDMHITIPYIALPIILTIVAVAAALFWPFKTNAYGIMNLFALVVALVFSVVVWIAYALLS